MEAGANSEITNQDNIKQEIKVDDFFFNEQNNNPHVKTDKDNESNVNPIEDQANINSENEVKIRKQINYFLIYFKENKIKKEKIYLILIN